MKKIIINILMIILALVVIGGGVFFAIQHREERDYRFSYDPGEFFVTDIQNSNRLLKTDMILAMADSREADFYIEHNHRIRNTIIFVLRNKDEEELKNPSIEQILNKKIIRELNQAFETEDFQTVYFNEFVIQ